MAASKYCATLDCDGRVVDGIDKGAGRSRELGMQIGIGFGIGIIIGIGIGFGKVHGKPQLAFPSMARLVHHEFRLTHHAVALIFCVGVHVSSNTKPSGDCGYFLFVHPTAVLDSPLSSAQVTEELGVGLAWGVGHGLGVTHFFFFRSLALVGHPL